MKARAKGRRHATAMRDVGAEVPGGGEQWLAEALAREPGPDEAAAVADQIEVLLRGLPDLHAQVLQMRLAALTEMVKIDMERRWQRGQPATLEHYLDTFPELGDRHSVAPDLILAECEVRRQFNDPQELERACERFAEQAPELLTR